MKKISVEIKSSCAMLQCRFATEQNGLETSKKKKKVYIAEEEAEKYLYRAPDKTIYQPSEHILGALIKAGSSFKYDKNKSYKDIIKASVLIEPDTIPLLDDKGIVKTIYDEIDNRAVVIQRARIVRSRPKFNSWILRFTITILEDDDLSVNTLKEILDKAGKYGIGDFRPRFGRFIVTSFKEVE